MSNASKAVTKPLEKSSPKPAELPLSRMTTYVDSAMELTKISIDPLLEAADLDRTVFLAALARDLATAVTRSDVETQGYFKMAPERFIADAAHQAASMGLVTGVGPTGRHASVLFRKKRQNVNGSWSTTGIEVNVQPEWRGVIHLIKRANPNIVDIKIELISPEDEVIIDRVNDEIVRHVSPGNTECEPAIHLTAKGFSMEGISGGYAVVLFADGRKRIHRLSKADFIRSASCSETLKLPFGKNKDNRPSSPWVLYTKAMCYKTIALALHRKPDIWSPSGGHVFDGSQLQAAVDKVNLLEGNRIIPPGLRDERVDELLEAIVDFGGTDQTLTVAAKKLGFDDPAIAISRVGFEKLADKVYDELRA